MQDVECCLRSAAHTLIALDLVQSIKASTGSCDVAAFVELCERSLPFSAEVGPRVIKLVLSLAEQLPPRSDALARLAAVAASTPPCMMRTVALKKLGASIA